MSLPHTCRCAICGNTMGGYLVDLSSLKPCECAGVLCLKQSSPNMMQANTYCKMPWAQVTTITGRGGDG